MTAPHTPTCYVIAGPNGAGKTTFALTFLPEFAGCRHFVNADLIAAGLSPLNPEIAIPEAGRLCFQRLRRLMQKPEDMALETTLSGRTLLGLLREAKQCGKKIVLIYLWLPSAEFSEARVLERVINGGQDVDEEILYRRYPKSMRNLAATYGPVADDMICLDNASPFPSLIFAKDRFGLTILDMDKYHTIYPELPESRTPAQNSSLAESAHRALRTAVREAILQMRLHEQEVIIAKNGQPFRISASRLVR